MYHAVPVVGVPFQFEQVSTTCMLRVSLCVRTLLGLFTKVCTTYWLASVWHEIVCKGAVRCLHHVQDRSRHNSLR
jgi:hypothetical protein